jgi:DNA-binding transcriptional LysR family regulator
MKVDLNDLDTFAAVVRAGGFREAARTRGASPSGLSDAVRRLEATLGLRLLHRTTRSVAPTEAGRNLLVRLDPILRELDGALDAVNTFRDRPVGTLKLNVPVSAVRLVLPDIIPAFLTAYPGITVEIIAEESFVDILTTGCDAGIRYEERLDQDMIAVPIGPRLQRYALGASPAYLDRHGRPQHPRDLLEHICLQGRFPSGAVFVWEFEREGETVHFEPKGPLVVEAGGATDLAIATAVAGVGIVKIFEGWLTPYFQRGELEPVLPGWCPEFSGPFLYYPGRRLVPAPLRAFIDFIKAR